jgi:drug/metabolite transporter (DMT)-like permease
VTPALTAGPVVFGAVLAAAAMHAGWNAFLKVRIEPFLAMALITAGAGVIGIPFMLAFGVPRAAAWPWLLGSVALHMGYYLALTEAYRRADMSQVYPIARGGAPLLTALVSFLLLTEPISAKAAAGVIVLGSGVALMSLRGRGSDRMDRAAVVSALITAAFISGYTLVDGIGARTSGDAGAYASTLFVVDGLPLPVFALWRRGAAKMLSVLRYAGQGLAGGAMALGSYWIAIWAMTVAPIALVAALRESSVLWAAVIAVAFLKEPILPPRALAAAMILCGLVLIRAG